jgi:hypothetical protein
VERGASHMRRYVLRSAGRQYDRDRFTNYNESKDVRFMEWAAISTAGLSDLLIMRRDVSAKNQRFTFQSYIEVLEDGLLPVLQANSIYQQHGARIHISKLAKSWFEKHGIHVLKCWPPSVQIWIQLSTCGLCSRKSCVSISRHRIMARQ